MKKKTTDIIIGAVFIIAGIIFGGNALDLWDVNFFFSGWWTIFIILPCIISMINDGVDTGNVIGLAIGVLLLLHAQGLRIPQYMWKLLVPAILVLVGLSIIFGSRHKKDFSVNINSSTNGGHAEYTSIFSHQDVNYAEKEFTGAEAVSIFGGMTLDLRYAHLTNDAVIDATSVFGGMDILVPADVNVKVNGTGIFGRTHNNVNKTEDMSMRTLYVNGTSIFGGIHIK